MNYPVFVLAVVATYLATRLLLAALAREAHARLGDHYRFIGPLFTPLHWVLLLASLLIGMSLFGFAIARYVVPFYLAIAWFAFRAFSILVFEGWFATVKGIQLPGVVRRLVSIVIGFGALLAFLRLRLDVRADDLAVITIVVGVVLALFFQGVLRDLLLGVSMALQQRIRVGDWVSIDGHQGQVAAVDWNTTTLQNERQERIVIPNRRVAEAVVVQVASDTRRRHQAGVSLPADIPPSSAIVELGAAVVDAPHVLTTPAPEVVYCGERAGEGRYEISFWLPLTVDGESVQSDLQVAIWYRLRRRGLVSRPTALEMGPEQVVDALRKLPFLGSASPAQIETLARSVRTVRYGKGEVVFRQDDRSDDLFLIHSGTLDISVMNGRRLEKRLASVGAGSFVGEHSLLTGEPRTATGRAAEDSILFVVSKSAIGQLLHEDPLLARQIAQVMAERDHQREEFAHQMESGGYVGDAHSMLRRIRAIFALE
jgi:CRP-like cAMP-binding protein/small-conductance mechanosensitive channel